MFSFYLPAARLRVTRQVVVKRRCLIDNPPCRRNLLSMILCRTMGPVELSVDGGPAPPELLWRKHLALLVYLARSPRRGRSREHLMGLLWGDRTDVAARHSLS